MKRLLLWASVVILCLSVAWLAWAATVTIGTPQTANWWACPDEDAAVAVVDEHAIAGYRTALLLFDQLGCKQLGPEPVTLTPLRVVHSMPVEGDRTISVVEMGLPQRPEERFWVITTSEIAP